MIYPFIPEDQFKDSIELITNGLANFSPFKLTFSEFQYFEHARSFTVFLKPQTEPPDALQQLHKILFDLFPYCDELSTKSENGFSPHLTVGQFTTKNETEVKLSEFNRNLKHIVFKVDKINLISRSGNDPFTIKFTIPIGQAPRSIDNKVKNVPSDILSKTDHDVLLISDRILNWLNRQKDLNKLPKTFNSLKSATQNLCKLPKEIIPANTVYDILYQEGYFTVLNEDITYNKALWNPMDQKRVNPNNEKEVVLNKCRYWISQPDNSPKFSFGLKNSLRQLVMTTYEVPQEDVLNLLEKIGSIRREPNDRLVVNI